MQKEADFDEKKEAQLKNDQYLDDSIVLSEEYESPDGTTYPIGCNIWCGRFFNFKVRSGPF